MKRYVVLTVLAVLAKSAVLGQAVNVPKVTPSSPSAAALAKFEEYPVSHYTGAIGVDVPIYTIEADGIKVPIQLKYHGSGIRYDDASMAVGIGWTLLAGGMVTYEQKGKPDNTVSTRFNKLITTIDPFADGSTSLNDNYSMKQVLLGNMDSEYDMYNFSFLGYSGKFFYPGTTSPVFSPRQNFKVNFNSMSGTFPSMVPLTMVDESGISYKFGPLLEQPVDMDPTTWNAMLTEIVSADKSDTVKFNYTELLAGYQGSYHIGGKFIIKDNVVVMDDPIVAEGTPPTVSATPSSPGHTLTAFGWNRLDNITFKTGRVVFSYDVNNRLTQVAVYNKTETAPVKAVSIIQSAYGDYYKLDEARFKDSNLAQSYSYRFEYNGTPWDKVSGIDYWGYYNGTPEPENYVPNFSTVFTGALATPGLADRAPNDTAMLKGILNRVYFPTGGHSDFTYEAHRYGTLGNIAGGARIKSIKNYDASNSLLGVKWYEYGVGTLQNSIVPDDYCYKNLFVYTHYPTGAVYFDYTMRERTFSAFPAFYSNLSQGSSVTYGNVTEYTGDGITSNGKTEYVYEWYSDQISHNNGGGSTGSVNFMPLTARSLGWKSGNLLSKSTYKYESGAYSSVSSVFNTYKDLNYLEYFDTKVLKYLDWRQTDYYGNGLLYDDMITYFSNVNSTPVYPLGLVSPYIYANYWHTSGAHVLDSVVTVNDGVSTMTRYSYEGTYDKPTSVTTRRGDGTFTVAQMTYPFDYPSTQPYTQMLAKNMLSPVIEQTTYKNSVSSANFLTSTKTDYAFWASGGAVSTVNNRIYPEKIWTKKSDPSGYADLRAWYKSYGDEGNVQEVHEKWVGPAASYIWGYNRQYPVAEARNANVNEIYHHNFEEAGDFSTAYIVRDNTRAHTGLYSGRLTNPNSTERVIHSNTWLQVNLGGQTKKFRYSGWVYSTGPGVELFLFMKRPGETGYFSYVDLIPTSQTNKWVYLDKEVTVPADVSQLNLRLDNNSAGDVWFDDLRIVPADATMTTYTHTPLVGITSATDNQGITIYYDYDNFKRLMNIRDKDGKIIKHMDYHYKQ